MMNHNRRPFNLIDEPFIPCITSDGEAIELGLRAALLRAHELRGLRDDSPLVTTALHRLLLAVLHAALGTFETLDNWRELWQSGKIDEATVSRYLDQWSDRFDLLDPVRPFYQAWNWELPADKRKGPNELAQELTRGNNATLFDHTADDPPPAFSCAEAARHLIANQTFAPAGGVSATGNRTGAPLVGQVIVIPVGATLWETLVLNLLPSDERQSEVLHPLASPCWERDEPTFAEPSVPQGYLDLLTWQPRRIRLHGGDDGTRIREISYSQGRKLELPEGCFDPMIAYRQERPVEFDDDRSVWRDSEALFAKSTEGRNRPEVMDFLSNLVNEGIVPASQMLTLTCAGLKNRQAKIFFWRYETLPLPLSYVDDDDLPPRLARAIADAEAIADRLKQAVKDAVTQLLEPTGGKADPKRRAQIVDSLAAERLYWSRLETPFRRFFRKLAAIPADQPYARQQRLAMWAIDDCERSAHLAYDESAGRLDRSARTLRALQRGHDSLRGRIGKYLSNHSYREAYRGEDENAS